MSPDDQLDLDPTLTDAVRRAYVRPVDEVTAQRHVSAMLAAAASQAGAPAPRPARPRRRVRRTVAATVAAVLVVPVGMAAAGVTLPEAVEKPYRAIGIDLPNQARPARSLLAPPPLTPAGRRAGPTLLAPTIGDQPAGTRGRSSSRTASGAQVTGTPARSATPPPPSTSLSTGRGHDNANPGQGVSKKPAATVNPGRSKAAIPPGQASSRKTPGGGRAKPAAPPGQTNARPGPAANRVPSSKPATTGLPPSAPGAADAAPGHNK